MHYFSIAERGHDALCPTSMRVVQALNMGCEPGWTNIAKASSQSERDEKRPSEKRDKD